MNEKIKELAKESGIVYICLDGRIIAPSIEGADISKEVEHFAELIVEECVDFLVERGERMKEELDMEKFRTLYYASLGLKEHFGVEK